MTPFSRQILESLDKLPQFELKIRKFQEIESTDVELFVTLSLLNNSIKGSPSAILLCGVSDGPLVEFQRVL